MTTIYLAGGLSSGWQDRVRAALRGPIYIDPRSSGLEDPAAYTAWNLEAVDRADIVLAYMERDNPSGFGLTLEVGFAVGRGKRVIVADERSALDPAFASRFATVREAASAAFDTLEHALEFLASAVVRT